MAKQLPGIGKIVFCDFDHVEECEEECEKVDHVEECEVVGYINNDTIEVEHQVADGMETVPMKRWFDEDPTEN